MWWDINSTPRFVFLCSKWHQNTSIFVSIHLRYLIGTWTLALLWAKQSLRKSWIETERSPAVPFQGQCRTPAQVWTRSLASSSFVCFFGLLVVIVTRVCSWLRQCYRDSGDSHFSDQAVKGFCWWPLQGSHQLTAGLLAWNWVQILRFCCKVSYIIFDLLTFSTKMLWWTK